MALAILQEILNVGSYKSQNHILKANQNVLYEPTQNSSPGQPFGDLCSDNDNHRYQRICRANCFLMSYCVSYSTLRQHDGLWLLRLE